MSDRRIYELTDCSEFRQTLLMRPPGLVHATVIVLTAFIGTAVLWAAMTEANLVVRATGRVRPMIKGQQKASAAAEESRMSPLRAGRVVEVHVQEGDSVLQGEVLIRLDTEQLENDIARKQRSIRSLKDELANLDRLQDLLKAKYEVAESKAAAELAQAEEALKRTEKNRSSEILLAKVGLELAANELKRSKKLKDNQAASKAQVELKAAKHQEAKLKLAQTLLPADVSQLPVLRQSLHLVQQEDAVARAQSDSQRQLKQAQLDATQLELANLQLQVRQSELRALSDGVVTSLDVEVGRFVQSGQAAVSVAEQRGYRMDVAVTSEDIGQLCVGMPVRIKLDAFDYQKFGSVSGKVVFVSPDSEIDSKSPYPRMVPTYLVKIEMDGVEVRRRHQCGEIRLGMTGTAEIITGHEGILWLLVRSIRQRISLG